MKKEIIITEEQKNTIDNAIETIKDILKESSGTDGWYYMELTHWANATTRGRLQTLTMSLENVKHIVAVE